jgi:hypothetical protein
MLLLSACDKSTGGPTSAESSTVDSGSESTADYPTGTCLELLPESPHPVNSYWVCGWRCGITAESDLQGDFAEQARMSYDLLEPAQPDGCYELRTALYQCFDALTCAEVAAFYAAGDAGTNGPCIAEYYALEPKIPECGI